MAWGSSPALAQAVAVLNIKLENLGERMDGCYELTRLTAENLSRYIENERKRLERERDEREAREKQERQERKRANRWVLTTSLTSASIVIAAIALFFHP